MYQAQFNNPYRNCVRNELCEFLKKVGNKHTDLCTKSMEEKADRPENGSFYVL